jgi:hypothetical protein
MGCQPIGILQVRPGAPRHVVHGHALGLKLAASAAVHDHQVAVGEPPGDDFGALLTFVIVSR